MLQAPTTSPCLQLEPSEGNRILKHKYISLNSTPPSETKSSGCIFWRVCTMFSDHSVVPRAYDCSKFRASAQVWILSASAWLCLKSTRGQALLSDSLRHIHCHQQEFRVRIQFCPKGLMRSQRLKDEAFSLLFLRTQRVIYLEDWLSITVISFTMGAWMFQPGPGTSCSRH